MAEIVNLRQARKRREREDRSAQAAENRVRFGRRKDEKVAEEVRRAQAERLLDGHRRDNGGDAEQ
ncbi:DUF4169 family protein [Methylopila sp. Yamaguchi]|uniref:DUF4169 family protein n=1 Tax=Methylopila sp. Yamaguchi TaxID=1437817 RepID=UPI000CC5B0E0|nr:DUF4169 family protein [Methylopila sp. Yamaguchi]GBD50067.1 hypothetical protein METY_3280 [Methylopila sp. Yamaguchi]